MKRGVLDEYVDDVVANENNCQRLITYAGAMRSKADSDADDTRLITYAGAMEARGGDFCRATDGSSRSDLGVVAFSHPHRSNDHE